jgi:hypothetical protein
MDHGDCRCPCTCGHAHDENLPVGCVFCRAVAAYQNIRGAKRKLDLKELARAIHHTNSRNGFDLPLWENLPAKVMFAVTELNEGMDAIRGDGEDPLTEELADTAIRILDLLHSIWKDDWADRTVDVWKIQPEGGFWEPGEVALWRPLRLLSQAVEAWRYERRNDVRSALELAVKELFIFGLKLGVDLHAVIEWKAEKNATRGLRHGKARSEG